MACHRQRNAAPRAHRERARARDAERARAGYRADNSAFRWHNLLNLLPLSTSPPHVGAQKEKQWRVMPFLARVLLAHRIASMA